MVCDYKSDPALAAAISAAFELIDLATGLPAFGPGEMVFYADDEPGTVRSYRRGEGGLPILDPGGEAAAVDERRGRFAFVVRPGREAEAEPIARHLGIIPRYPTWRHQPPLL